MQTASALKGFEPVQNLPRHFKFSEKASTTIVSDCYNWHECITILMKRECYSDALMLLSIRLPLSLGIEWGRWTLQNHGPAQASIAPLNQSNNADSPDVWLDAADFWNEQIKENSDEHVSDLAREAIYSAISLIVLTSQTPPRDVCSKVIRKGLELLTP
ncbi:MAG: hypothetical protein R3240_03345 [Gammaproteobacteria bacterium]|nr:hypothetical protein [Gammaproteobacteria bacterium]